MKSLWLGQASKVTIDPGIVEEMKSQIKAFDAKIKWRDRLEIGVALFFAPFLLLLTIIVPFPLAKLGAALTAVSMFVIVFVLKINQKKRKAAGTSLTEQIEAEVSFLKKQRSLLTNVLYWYLLPPFIGISLFLYGMRRSEADFWWNEGIITVVITVIWYVNRQAVKREINPSLQSLQGFLNSLRRK